MRPLAILAVVLSSVTLGLDAAAAPESACRVVEALGAATPSPAWRHALDALERELESSPDTCHGVELTVTWEAGGVRVAARAADGAEASRPVAAPFALSAVAFGLLASAPAEPAAPPRDPDEARPPPAPTPAQVEPFDVVSRLDVSTSVGARAGFPTNVIMGDFEARADLFIHRWLLSVAIRAAPFSHTPRLASDADAYQEAGVGLGLGRELHAGKSAFDLSGGPNLAYVWMENDNVNLSVEHAQLRLAGVARWGYPVGAHVRMNAIVDADFAPGDMFRNSYPAGLAPFPEVTVGIRIGAEVAL